MFRQALEYMDASILAVFGEEASYTPPGGGAAVACSVVIDRDVEGLGEYGQVVERRTEMTLASHVGARVGGHLVVAGVTWRVEALEQDEGSLTRVVMRKEP